MIRTRGCLCFNAAKESFGKKSLYIRWISSTKYSEDDVQILALFQGFLEIPLEDQDQVPVCP